MTSDLESARSNERTPILSQISDNLSAPKLRTPKNSKVSNLLHFLGGGVYAPDSSTYDPIEILLNEKDKDERDRLTERWATHKLDELSFIGTVATLLMVVSTSTGSWPDILSNNRPSPWWVRTAWYCSIILALCSILCSADQTVRLHRIAAHQDGWRNLRSLLAKSSGKGSNDGRIKPYALQVYTWQLSALFLVAATVTLVIGMFLHVWSGTREMDKFDVSNSNAIIAIIFSVIAALSIAVYCSAQFTLYSTEADVE